MQLYLTSAKKYNTELIRATWEDDRTTKHVLPAKSSARNAVMPSDTSAVPLMQKVLLDRRHGRALLLAVTEDANSSTRKNMT